MKILAIADEESKYLWDYFEKSKLEGIDLIIPAEIWTRDTFPSLPHLHRHRCSMFTETMMTNTKRSHRKAASALTTNLLSMKEYEFWGLGGSMRYKPGTISITEWEMTSKGC